MAFKITDSAIKKLGAQFEKALNAKINSSKARGNLSRALKPFMEEQIEFAIAGKTLTGNTVTCKAFRPDLSDDPDMVGKLGVGDGTGVDDDKIKNGWRALLPKHSQDSAAKVTISFAKDSFGIITYTLDKEKFFNAKINNFISHSDGKSQRIPWMQFFIEGQDVQDYEYKAGGKDEFPNSRTGLGVMKKLPSFTFSIPPQPDPFPRISTSIRAWFSRPTVVLAIKPVILKAIS